jgi:hypothetical protein
MNETDTRTPITEDPPGQSPLDFQAAGRDNRIDPPHRLANGRDADAPPAAEPTTDDEVEIASLAMVQQLRLQAQQLSEHLGREQANLDRREAELQSRAAQLEQHERTNRLWLKDRHEELAERQRALAAREDQLRALDRREAAASAAETKARERMREIEAAAAALNDAARAHDQLLEDLERRSADFDTRRTATLDLIRRFLSGQHLSAASRATPNIGLARDELDELADLLAQLQHRRTNIAEVESHLRRAETDIAEFRQALASDRKQFDLERHSDRRRQESRQLAEADLERRRQALEIASQQVELRRAAVDQLQAELRTLQRETLETRLAAEEVLAELTAVVPHAQLSRRINQARARLADYYRVEQDDLNAQRQQLEALAVQISQQHERLDSQKRELDEWLRRRRSEAAAAAARLAQREDQIEQQAARLERQRFDWHHERQEYQYEIARLLAELGR